MFEKFIEFTREMYGTSGRISLHEPQFMGNERKYVLEAIDSTFVSSIGKFVDQFEESFSEYIGSNHAIATMNGTSALHIALVLAGVESDDHVLTQSLSFVATTNSIHYCNADPIFIDVDIDSLSLSPEKLSDYLKKNCEINADGFCVNKATKKKIKACLPMHTFGFPAEIDKLKPLCDEYNIILIEDAAEALGSFNHNKHTGTESLLSVFSFNGNKLITTGGGGMIVTDSEKLASRAKHLTTTAKILDGFSWGHDELGYNYRLPNINSALGLAQLEVVDKFLDSKRQIASNYQNWFKDSSIKFVEEREGTKANYWLNTIILENRAERDIFLKETNENKVNTRSVWEPMHTLPFNKKFIAYDLENTIWLSERLVNLPSSPIL
tara:strand:- start:396 stop:1538 length:1143 start_codon:yes stop_codon:yes gene_type:complete